MSATVSNHSPAAHGTMRRVLHAIRTLDPYLRTRAGYDPRWACWHERGSFEVYGFGLALTVSWVQPTAPARA